MKLLLAPAFLALGMLMAVIGCVILFIAYGGASICALAQGLAEALGKRRSFS